MKRTIFLEKELSDRNQECMEIIELILKFDFIKIVLNLDSYYPKLVQEFIVNLSPSFDSANSLDFGRVHV